ncbi:hypothetical protein [uncultured Hymenobacter sp.]|uniref:hypothetical protein n=1 Tax=uncultured Hymenobacter sp. TaxID=170016 RepID=UPI0035CA3DD0
MHLLYLVFGPNSKNHAQAAFSMLTFLRQSAALTGITILTDAPDFYRHLSGHITVVPVSEATLEEWKGEFNFFWRIKIKALEYLARQQPNTALMYLDSDTFLHGSLAELSAALGRGEALMHEPEGALAALRSKTERLMWQQTKGQTFGGVSIKQTHEMWNAGVVAVPARNALSTIALALQICDELCRAQVTPRLIEQFALAVALAEKQPLHTARPYIGHYWSTKEQWQEHIGGFFIESHLRGRGVAEELAALADFNFGATPVKRLEKNTLLRVQKLVGKLFPAREVVYAGTE